MSYTNSMSENTVDTNAPVPSNTLVEYHGSVQYAHGLYTVVETHPPLHSSHLYDGGVAYSLAPANEDGTVRVHDRTPLYNVRRSSFTPKVANPKRTKVK